MIGLVAQKLEAEHIHKTLLCNIHLLMMLPGRMKEFCQDIHNSLGNKKITDCFLVDVEFKSEPFVIKSLKCQFNFISRIIQPYHGTDQDILPRLQHLKRTDCYPWRIAGLTGSTDVLWPYCISWRCWKLSLKIH